MGAEQVGGLEDLMMGNVSEGSEETSEQIAARIAASQARIAAVKKDEQAASNADVYLAKVIKKLPLELLRFVAWMIDLEIPSFTILSILTLVSTDAKTVLRPVFEKTASDAISFLGAIHNEKISGELTLWCRSIVMVDRQSNTVNLEVLKKDKAIHAKFAGGLRMILEDYLLVNQAEFNPNILDTLAKDVAGWVCVK